MAREFRKQSLKKDWEKIERTLHHQSLSYIPTIICTELISRHYDDLLARHFGIEKTQELIAQKYYWPLLCHNIETYLKGYNVCLTSKTVRHKPYEDL